MARRALRMARDVDPSSPDAVRACCVPLLLDPHVFLQDCAGPVCAQAYSVIAAYILLVGASLADEAVPVGECVFAAALVRHPLSYLALPPWSRILRSCPPPFRPSRGAEAEALLGCGVVPD